MYRKETLQDEFVHVNDAKKHVLAVLPGVRVGL